MKLDELKSTATSSAILEKEVKVLVKKVEDEISGYKISLQRAMTNYQKELESRFQDYFKEKGFHVQSQDMGLRAWFQSCEILFMVPHVLGGPTGQVPIVLEIKESKSNYKKSVQIFITPQISVDLSAKDRLKKAENIKEKKNVAEQAIAQLLIDIQEPIVLLIGTSIGNDVVLKKDFYELLAELETHSMF